MGDKVKVAELLVSIGVDSADAERAAAKLDKTLRKTADGAEDLGNEAEDAGKKVDLLGEATKRADKFSDLLAKGLKAAATALGVIGGAVIKTGSDFETLGARLKTVTGSAAAADEALAFIKTFAKDTPFEVEQITDSFIKLKNLGIDPTRETLEAFGNIAAGNSKSLDQLTEAALDASTGEFERLKEFGIRASQQGDEVALTFRGITTTIGKDAESITGYLRDLGNNEFAGAMSERMMTLEGVLSNAKDAFTNFLLEVANDGVLAEFKALIGDITNEVGGQGGLAKTLSETLTKAIRGVRNLIKGNLGDALKGLVSLLGFVVDKWEILVGLMAGAKTFSAFQTAAKGIAGLSSGFTAALGPIGAFTAAMLAAIPIAIEMGDAFGEAIAMRNDFLDGPRTKKRGAGKHLGAFTADEQSRLASKQAEVDKFAARVKELNESGSLRGRRAAIIVARDRDKAESERAALEAKFSANRDARDAAAAEQSQFEAEQDAALAEIEVGPEFVETALRPDRPKRTGSRRKAKDPTKFRGAPRTISDFFKAANNGDLGPIAAATPAAKDIEPTVAVTINNYNTTNNNKFDIKSTDPRKAGMEVVAVYEQMRKAEYSRAGAGLAGVVER